MDLFNHYKNLTYNHRIAIIDWISEIGKHYKLKYCTVQLSFYILDDYLINETNNIISLDLQKISITCLVLAAKSDSLQFFDLSDAEHICDYIYSLEELEKIELRILEKIKFRVLRETHWQHIKNIVIKKSLSNDIYTVSYYFSNLIVYKPDYLLVSPKKLAKKIITLATYIYTNLDDIFKLSKKDIIIAYMCYLWNEDMAHNKFGRVKRHFERLEIRDFLLESFQRIQYCTDNIDIKKFYQLKTNSREIKIYTGKEITSCIKIKKLGQGTYGRVDHCILNNKEIALKTSCIIDLDGGIDRSMIREVDILTSLNHENIIKMHGFFYDQIQGFMYIALELMECPLSHKIIKPLSNETKFSYIKQLIKGVQYLHQNNIMHRDLTIDNVLVSKTGELKICDFGLSRNFYHPDILYQYHTNVCSITFRAIELLLGCQKYNSKIDIWSTACIIGSILIGNKLFSSKTEPELVLDIFNILGSPTKDDIIKMELKEKEYPIINGIGFKNLEENYPEITTIIYAMLSYDIEDRLNINEVVNLFDSILD
ncbi:kinase [Moumouvirus goulette]|uniref:Kinase n=1 Tax=Moumouvirus goulette TaxID=1247379 RepID=M1PG87_9VIRU|nr:kinase [Moumouvirus goulette]AGF84993.1 kinase [Moumouvirus goulette]